MKRNVETMLVVMSLVMYPNFTATPRSVVAVDVGHDSLPHTGVLA